jgi:hypothetical protein
MLTAFLDAEDIVHHEYVLEKLAVSGKFYKEVIKRLIARIHQVMPEFQESGPVIFCTTMHRCILRALSPSF